MKKWRLLDFMIVSSLLAFPFLALAQYIATGTAGDPGAVSLPVTGGSWLSFIIKALAVPLLGLIGVVLRAVLDHFKSGGALGKVAELLDVIGTQVWGKVGPELQAALADGRLTPEEKAHLIITIESVLPDLVSKDTLNAAMKALGVPTLGGLAGWILAKLMPRIAGAHDDADASVPNAVTAVYPIEHNDPSPG